MSRIGRLLGKIRGLALRTAEDIHGAASRALATRRTVRRGVAPDAARLETIRRQADALLADNVLPFWASHAFDDRHGGFVTHLDRAGQWFGPTDKYLVPQTRLIWTFAAAHRHGITDRGYLDLSERGARFLIDHMWDADAGGFVWAVQRDGRPLVADKRTYGQAFAIYALSEYALATGSEWARDWAVKTYDVLTERAGDGAFGFCERFDGQWRPLPGRLGSGKTVNTHLHVMEALVPLFQATGDARHAAQLRAALDLVLSRGVHPRDFYAIDDLLERDWRWKPKRSRPIRISYGHGAELAWLAQQAVEVLGDPPERIRDVVLGLIDHALDFGFDHRRGGIAEYGPPLGHARFAWYLGSEACVKRWWEQAEMPVALLTAYELTGVARYLTAFERQFDWIWSRQIDHEYGDWFDSTDWRTGKPLTLIKGHEWKEPYHGTRALMEVSRRLSALIGTSSVR